MRIESNRFESRIVQHYQLPYELYCFHRIALKCLTWPREACPSSPRRPSTTQHRHVGANTFARYYSPFGHGGFAVVIPHSNLKVNRWPHRYMLADETIWEGSKIVLVNKLIGHFLLKRIRAESTRPPELHMKKATLVKVFVVMAKGYAKIETDPSRHLGTIHTNWQSTDQRNMDRKWTLCILYMQSAYNDINNGLLTQYII